MTLAETIDGLIATHTARLSAAATPADLMAAATELKRDFGVDPSLLGAGGRQVVMIQGMVVSKEAFEPFRARVEGLTRLADERRAAFARVAAEAAAAAWQSTLRLFCDAELVLDDDDGGDPTPVTAAAELEKCHGVSEETDLDGLDHSGTPVLPLSIEARLHYHPDTQKLSTVIEVPLSKAPTATQTKKIVRRVEGGLLHGWGLNYELPVPDGVQGRIAFAAKVAHSEVVPGPAAGTGAPRRGSKRSR